MITRRDFLKMASATMLAAACPRAISTAGGVVRGKPDFVECIIDEDKLREAISVDTIRLKDGQGMAECSIDLPKAWEAVSIVDSEGRYWHTPDGKSFRHRDGNVETTIYL